MLALEINAATLQFPISKAGRLRAFAPTHLTGWNFGGARLRLGQLLNFHGVVNFRNRRHPLILPENASAYRVAWFNWSKDRWRAGLTLRPAHPLDSA